MEGAFFTHASSKQKRAVGNAAAGGGRGRRWLAPGRQTAALGPRSAPPARRGEASSARPSPEARPRTTCCCLGALRPSLRKFTPRRASPGRLGLRVNPHCPGHPEPALCPGARPRELLRARGPAEQRPGPRLGSRGLPGYPPRSPGPADLASRAPRRASSPRWGPEVEGILRPVPPLRIAMTPAS